MNWFENLFGFKEAAYSLTRSHFCERRLLDGAILLESKIDGREFDVGRFTMPTLESLRNEYAVLVEDSMNRSGHLRNGAFSLTNIVADVRDLHRDPLNKGAVFQVASQFNCLEMPNMNLTPEDGITNYINDPTQGPACAMECAPGTLYRNYFGGLQVNVNPDGTLNDDGGESLEPGQHADRQINCLVYLGKALGNSMERYWHLKNGYALPCESTSLDRLSDRLQSLSEDKLDDLEENWLLVCSGILNEQRVSQVYASAVPVAYAAGTTAAQWEPFARLVLRGCYESTLLVAALLAIEQGKREKVYLTLVGGGVFGNDEGWIVDAIRESLVSLEAKFGGFLPIDVVVVHHSRVKPAFAALEDWAIIRSTVN
ncbi:conserved hypothetical protein [Perkinsus marinus ATCC 50983]|uniref:Uncharacterized protein n=1 Tax=Perkinsus marinus (strain ATCC 50983 / TXsc) TaxID=423536 RepID=C5KJY0_PERM5|nr:conserved hypothetical protein [Perkinsus marinus ATCC 50983]EER15238.1 conserved hypothetical protein [Perkinsus marinus ATCC 50983]|eukprot:XP_002783442.1 conserved hypothetical protein [Perkinsus marinus ATCC 50983]